MGLFNVFEISSAGMAVEQTKLSVAAANLANARTTRAPDGSIYEPLAVIARTSAGQGVNPATFTAAEQQLSAAALPRPVVTDIVPTNAPVKLLYDPGHPDANSQGMVAYPGVDPLGTMLDLLSISRSYEANLRAFDITRSLIQRTIDIGRNR